MSKRIAYIGLSTPVGYDYKNEASKAPADVMSSPNPILDSPFGLFLLFDEIWFLTRSLCPENLRSASFVKFLDEENKISFINDTEVDSINKSIVQVEREMYSGKTVKRIEEFAEVIRRVTIGQESSVDNHTHGLKIGDTILSGNPVLDRLLFDMEIVKRLDNSNVELITNSFTQTWFEGDGEAHPQMELAEAIVINNIPNYMSLKGPYHPCVEDARENSYLKYFRKWIIEHPKHIDRKELLDIQSEVEEAIRKSQAEIFLKYFDPKNHYTSVGKSIFGDVVGSFIPGVSAVSTAIEETVKFINTKDRRWQAFIVSLQNQK